MVASKVATVAMGVAVATGVAMAMGVASAAHSMGWLVEIQVTAEDAMVATAAVAAAVVVKVAATATA